jgi:transposase
MKVTRLGLDLATQVFQVHGLGPRGRQVSSPQLKRGQVEGFFRRLVPG